MDLDLDSYLDIDMDLHHVLGLDLAIMNRKLRIATRQLGSRKSNSHPFPCAPFRRLGPAECAERLNTASPLRAQQC